MEPVNISYRIKLDKKNTEVFDFTLDGKTFELIKSDTPADAPSWTALEYKQCSNCPLKKEQHPHCPLALQISDIVKRLGDTQSIDEVHVEVITDERVVSQTTAIQRVVASMFGLVFPTCGCPKTAHMRPMARFHLPLASEEETVFRVTGMYLLAQYFLHNTGTDKGQFDFGGLIKIYEDLHILNTAMSSRLQLATRSDTTFNAVTLLDMYATLVPMLLEDELVEMRGFFAAFLPADAPIKKSKHNYLEKAKAFTLELLPIEGELPKPGEKKRAVFSIGDDEPPPPKKPVVKTATPETDDDDADIPVLSQEPDAAPAKPAFSLSLAPLAGEKTAEPATEKKKAVFSLPDEPPPPKKP